MIPLHRALLFLIGCIGIRALFAYIAKIASPTILQWLGALALLPVIGWALIIIFELRETGPEAGGKIWWKNIRIVHASFYALFAALAIMKNPNAWVVLATDTTFGLFAFLAHHFGGWNP
jgi:hypothetical protein